ncbi:hypothetical protein BJX99DRAFT_257802 [Aspergillus californicus]
MPNRNSHIDMNPFMASQDSSPAFTDSNNQPTEADPLLAARTDRNDPNSVGRTLIAYYLLAAFVDNVAGTFPDTSNALESHSLYGDRLRLGIPHGLWNSRKDLLEASSDAARFHSAIETRLVHLGHNKQTESEFWTDAERLETADEYAPEYLHVQGTSEKLNLNLTASLPATPNSFKIQVLRAALQHANKRVPAIRYRLWQAATAITRLGIVAGFATTNSTPAMLIAYSLAGCIILRRLAFPRRGNASKTGWSTLLSKSLTFIFMCTALAAVLFVNFSIFLLGSWGVGFAGYALYSLGHFTSDYLSTMAPVLHSLILLLLAVY